MKHEDLSDLFKEWQRKHPKSYEPLSLGTSTVCHGLGIFTRTEVAKGDIIYEDSYPLVAMQFAYSRYSGAICCEHCLCSVGGLADAFDHVLDLKDMSLAEDFPAIVPDIVWLDSLQQNPTGLPCKCGQSQYCSEDCQRLDQPAHGRLCSNPKVRHELQTLALEHNEFFLLAAKAVSVMADRMQTFSWTAERALSEFICFAIGPVRGEIDEGIRRSHELILKLIPETELAELRDEFTIDQYARLLRVFEVNDMLINYDHFSLHLLRVAGQCPHGQALQQSSEWSRLVNLVRRLVPYDDENAPSLTPFPEFLGSGLYRGVALTNHSCSPNAEASFGSSRALQVTALAELRAGEEVLQSYIDEHLPLAVRQSKLKKAYGFICRCARCRKDALLELQHRRDDANG
ncbi:SET and MYND domain-containing protein 5 [Perkinsus chesapeaki]|uniref:SET and MYND domain-containing protein 5 n=1 Tax=Perkinsus chesapeaki TaxID=330153 RepID=A0A7J6MLW0_PERCH|nr:SET and MYND domain-containing protein 5 [Perkinsus chesapeaki]